MNSEKPIKTLVTEFLQDQDIKEISRMQYQVNLNRWLIYCIREKIDVRNPRRADVITFKNYLLKQEKSTNTVDGYLTTVRKFFSWLELQGIYDNVAAGVHSPRKYRGHRKGYLKPEQVTKILSMMPKNTFSEIRNFAILNLMVRTGIRRVEVQRMNVGDIYLNEGRPVIRLQRKRQDEKNHVIGVTDKIIDPIQNYLVLRNDIKDTDPLFVNHSRYHAGSRINEDTISRLIKQAFRAAGIDDKKITAHSLRHSAAITALRSGSALIEVQEMLGHTSIETTRIYLSAIDAEIRLDNPAVRALDVAF
jgi:integrase/recombinase XerD